ncbi:MAG: dienelactone hydrolase [Acidimicrobiales bacterium]|jgi:predicted dienelactone hydrolase
MIALPVPAHQRTGRAVVLMLTFALFAFGCSGSDRFEARKTLAENANVDPTEVASTPEPEPTAEPTTAPEPAEQATPAPTAAPEEPSLFTQRGPYAVGVVTHRMDDRYVEVWYPVDPTSVVGEPTETFDALTAFPETLRAIVPPELSGEYDTLAVRDPAALPDSFPVVIYGHGFGGYRQIATHFTGHLASWGFVVASTDHLERGIAEQTLDLVGDGLFDESNSRPDASIDDVRNTIDLLATLNIEGPLAGTMDLERLAISGHSAGAFAAVQASDAEPGLIDGWISISGGTREGIELTQPGLVIIGELDAVVPAERSYELFATSGGPRALLNVQGAGHNSFTDPCRGITDLGGLGALIALLGEEQVARAEDGCTPGSTQPEIAQAVVNHVAIAWLYNLFGLALTGNPLSTDIIAAIAPLADFQPE